MKPASVPLEASDPRKISGAGALLRRYFYSGWAFLIPYLLFYLLYYWQKWPVNPLLGQTLGDGGHIPALLHIYWALHGLHLILGFLALRSWWQNSMAATSYRGEAGISHSPSATPHSPDSGLWPLASRLLPWFLLALIFYIPGVYLEWPSDPWEHLRRINEWSVDANVAAHSSWFKSGYFLIYSFVGKIPAIHQLAWLNVYYTGICLVLCWQYYRLALATGLSERSSMIFVLLQTLLLGNDAFSFYRYYGISSSIYAQLGAIALTRLGLDAATIKLSDARIRTLFSSWAGLTVVLGFLTSALCLLALTAFNHIQGIGIAALGLAAVFIWRLIAWKRSSLWWLVIIAIGLSVTAIWKFPRHPALDQMYRPQGYLNAWYGFNVLSLGSPGGDRMLQIVGAIGLVNFIAGLLLLHRNHIVGWLTITPAVALLFPFISIPVAGALARHYSELNIITFQRMLFAIPSGLALVFLFQQLLRFSKKILLKKYISTLSIGITIAAFVAIPANAPYYNHAWNALFKVSDDLNLKIIWNANAKLSFSQNDAILAAAEGLSAVRIAQAPLTNAVCTGRGGSVPSADIASILIEIAKRHVSGHLIVAAPRPAFLYTPYSFAALCSTHWLPQEAAFISAGAKELPAACRNAGLRPFNHFDEITYYENTR